MNKCGSATERLKARAVENENGCWIWSGNKTAHGYGKMCVNGVGTAAHRYSYSVHKGPIPDGMFVCHTCDTPSCVNPDHLFVGTPKDNYDDMMKKGRGKELSHEGRSGADNGNDIVERPGAASGDRSARTTGCASNGTNNERTDK